MAEIVLVLLGEGIKLKKHSDKTIKDGHLLKKGMIARKVKELNEKTAASSMEGASRGHLLHLHLHLTFLDHRLQGPKRPHQHKDTTFEL